MRKSFGAAGVLAILCGSIAPAGAASILGLKIDLKGKPGFPQTRKMTVKARELASPDTLSGDPATNGATLQVIVVGATSSTQTITLPPGVRWKRSPQDVSLPAYRWQYKESRRYGIVSPVSKLDFRSRFPGDQFRLAATLYGKYVPLDIALPNPGSYAGVVLTIGGGGGSYCTNFGGDAGGSFTKNDGIYLRIARPTSEGTCPSGTPVCGDNVIDSPFETCDGTNDAACPGLCGSNGLQCLCPYCGDASIDPGESCDTHASLGSCTEGCSYSCACTTCGNDVVETPVEDCEPSGPPYQCGDDSTCGSIGNPDACRCSYCGDNYVNRVAEQCDGTDDSACPGNCLLGCVCAVCGNNNVEGTEQCDGTEDYDCPGACQPDCTCP